MPTKTKKPLTEKKTIPLFKVFMPPSVMGPLRETLLSGFIGQGSKVEEFEGLLRKFLRSKNVLSLNSGTSALTLALRLAGIKEGDEVISTALTCTATNWPVLALGGKLVWADINPKTANIDPVSIEAAVTPKTKAILVVHWGGYPCDMDEIHAIAKKHNLKVIEDGAHAFGSTYHGKMAGTQSDFGTFSFQAIKHMTTVDGGLLICKNTEDYKSGKLLRWYGIDREGKRKDFRCEEDILDWGYKFHMNDVSAVIGIEQMKFIENTLGRHRENAAFYRKALNGVPGVELLDEKTDRSSSYWLFTIKVQNRDGFMKKMTDAGIMVSRVHERNDKHTCTQPFRRELPQLDQFVKSMICIPVGWWVTKDDCAYIVDQIKKGW